MYTLNLPQTLTTVRVEEAEYGAWMVALVQTLEDKGFDCKSGASINTKPFCVIVVDSLSKTAVFQGFYGLEDSWHRLPSIRQVLKVNNNAVMYDRLHTLADGSLGNATVSSYHLMD